MEENGIRADNETNLVWEMMEKGGWGAMPKTRGCCLNTKFSMHLDPVQRQHRSRGLWGWAGAEGKEGMRTNLLEMETSQ